ncbi:MAG: acyltransferase family protein [Ruminococcus sp.]|nr:acyltransferase family protein [Ruminococcus sp.]
MAEGRRVAKWDNFKFILILLVVVGHFFNFLRNDSEMFEVLRQYIYLFHMPAFIFISGMMGKRTIDEKRWDKVTPYLLFYLLLTFLNFIPKAIIEGETQLELFSNASLPWYMLAIFIMFALTFYLKKFNPIFVFTISMICCIFAGYTTEDTQVLAFLRVINYYPFFLMGYYIKPADILRVTENVAVKIASAVILIGVLVAFFVIDLEECSDFFLLLSGQNAYDKMGDLAPWGGLLRLSVTAAATLMTFALISITPRRKTFFTKFGSRTLAIYSLHYVIEYILVYGVKIQDIFQNIFKDFWEWPIIILGIALTFICGNKYFHKWIMTLFDSRRWLRK